MTPEDIGHALLTQWAEWWARGPQRCCLWYPSHTMRRHEGRSQQIYPPTPTAGLMPRMVKATHLALEKLPRTARVVVSAKYTIPGDDSYKWVELGISRSTWYRQIRDARCRIGKAAKTIDK